MDAFRLFLAYCVAISHIHYLSDTHLAWLGPIGGMAVKVYSNL